MSDVAPESPGSNRFEDIIDEDINVDLLIEEVQKRPGLYSKYTDNNNVTVDKDTKARLWTEICQALFLLWDDYTPEKKLMKVKEVRSKWRHLRDAFFKKYAEENHLTPSGKKKRKYYYYDSMKFLVPTPPPTETNVSQDNNNVQDLDFGMAISQENMPSTSANVLPNILEPIPNIPYPPTIMEPRAEEVDENTHFALMLAPMMRKFNDEQRYFARSQILDIMRSVRKMEPPSLQICNIDQLKYAEGQAIPVVQQEQVVEPEVGTSGTAQQPLQYPDIQIQVPDRSTQITVVRNESGEIQYPETDPEDFE